MSTFSLQPIRVYRFLFFSILLMVLLFAFYQSMTYLYNPKNHVFVHTILEFFSVIVCISISLYGWKAYDDTTRKTYLWLPFIFLSIGVLDFFHLMSYPGMPFFVTESSLEKTAWFWIAARYTASIGLLFLIFSKEKIIEGKKKKSLSLATFIYISLITVIIFLFEKELPILIVSQVGPTNLKNALEYLVSLIILITIFKAYKNYKVSKLNSDLELFIATNLLLISEISLTFYHDISDVYVVLGHLIKSAGYYYILKAYLFSGIQLTFTQKQEAEKGLRQLQEVLHSFFFHTPDSITIMDTEGRVLKVNAGFEKVYGWQAHEVEGRLFREIMPHASEDIDKVIYETSSGKSLIAYETIRPRKDGTNITISMTISPIRNEAGEIIQLSAISRDITKLREAEVKLLETERELKDTVHKQQGIIFKFKKINEKYIHTLCDGQLLNEMNIDPENVVGKEMKQFLSKHDSDYIADFYERAWLGIDTTFEMVMANRICAVTLRPIKREKEVVEVIGSCMDITQLKKTEALLQKSEKLAVVGELAAGLAHEIRNPLTTLKGFTQLIESEEGIANKDYLNLMLSELDRIELITNEFMAVAKPQMIKFQEHNLISLVKQVVSFSTPQALLKNIEIQEKYDNLDSSIICEGNQIKQVLINLFKNAMEAMPNGGKLEVLIEQQDKNILIKIKDSGVGIPKEILPKLGEPFYTLKEKGTGLGLMVSFRIIESHKGTITFSSEINHGTTVTISLPFEGTV